MEAIDLYNEETAKMKEQGGGDKVNDYSFTSRKIFIQPFLVTRKVVVSLY